MTIYVWTHLECNGDGPDCIGLLTTASSKNGKALPGAASTEAKAGWKYKAATKTLPRMDFCPVCVKNGLAK